MCSHYIILVAFKGSCQSIKDVLFRQQTGTKIIFVKGTVQHFGQITHPPPPQTPEGGGHIKIAGCSFHQSICQSNLFKHGKWLSKLLSDMPCDNYNL